MVDVLPQFEIVELSGSTDHFAGTVTTSPIEVPSIPDRAITEILIKNNSVSGVSLLEVSFDGGTHYFGINRGDVLIWGPRGHLTSVFMRSSDGETSYDVLLNRESP